MLDPRPGGSSAGGSHESGTEGQNPLPQPAGHNSFNAAQEDPSGFTWREEFAVAGMDLALLSPEALCQPSLCYAVGSGWVVQQRQKGW